MFSIFPISSFAELGGFDTAYMREWMYVSYTNSSYTGSTLCSILVEYSGVPVYQQSVVPLKEDLLIVEQTSDIYYFCKLENQSTVICPIFLDYPYMQSETDYTIVINCLDGQTDTLNFTMKGYRQATQQTFDIVYWANNNMTVLVVAFLAFVLFVVLFIRSIRKR